MVEKVCKILSLANICKCVHLCEKTYYGMVGEIRGQNMGFVFVFEFIFVFEFVFVFVFFNIAATCSEIVFCTATRFFSLWVRRKFLRYTICGWEGGKPPQLGSNNAKFLLQPSSAEFFLGRNAKNNNIT